MDGPASVLTAFGVDLLYPGLDLEIEAMAIVDPDRKNLSREDIGGCYQPEIFSQGVNAAGETYMAGQVAMDSDGSPMHPGDVSAQARVVFERMRNVLAETGMSLNNATKLNLFIVGDGQDVSDSFHNVCNVWSEMAPVAHPAMIPVRVHELARSDFLVQADCTAIKLITRRIK